MAERKFATLEWQQTFAQHIASGDLPAAIHEIQSLATYQQDSPVRSTQRAIDTIFSYISLGGRDAVQRRETVIGALLCAGVIGESTNPYARFALPTGTYTTETYEIPVQDTIGLLHGQIARTRFTAETEAQHPSWKNNATAAQTIDRLFARMQVDQGFGALPGFRSIVTEFHTSLTTFPSHRSRRITL